MDLLRAGRIVRGVTPVRGREKELAVLGDLLQAAAVSGAGRVAVVEGPAGIGKSRLLAAVAELAAGYGLLVAAGRADELDRVTPWAPLLGAVTSASPLSDAVDLSSLGDLVDRRLEVIDRFRGAFEVASSHRPILVVIDDLQWADPATLMALGSLPRQLFSYPVSWILARRPVPAIPQLRTLLARLEDDGGMGLRLGALDPAASAAVAADVLGAEPDQQAAALVAEAAGNPFYLVELLKATRGGALAREQLALPGAEAPVPRSFRSAVAAHLRALSPDASQFVKVACVLGRVFSLEEVAAMTGEPASRLLPAVEEALAAEVLIEEGDRIAFRHDLLRQAVDQDLPRPVREALHRDAGTALMATGAPLIRVASQLAAGARPGDEQAIAVLEQAIAELAGASPMAAADLAVRALDLIGPDDPRRAQMVARAVRPLGWAGRLDEALALGEGYLADHHPPRTLKPRSCWVCGWRG
jgi:predicted ATPase